MKWIYTCLALGAAVLIALYMHLAVGDAAIRRFCESLPMKLSPAEVRTIADGEGLWSEPLPDSQMRVSKRALGGLIPRALSCRVAFNRELLVEYRTLEGG